MSNEGKPEMDRDGLANKLVEVRKIDSELAQQYKSTVEKTPEYQESKRASLESKKLFRESKNASGNTEKDEQIKKIKDEIANINIENSIPDTSEVKNKEKSDWQDPEMVKTAKEKFSELEQEVFSILAPHRTKSVKIERAGGVRGEVKSLKTTGLFSQDILKYGYNRAKFNDLYQAYELIMDNRMGSTSSIYSTEFCPNAKFKIGDFIDAIHQLKEDLGSELER